MSSRARTRIQTVRDEREADLTKRRALISVAPEPTQNYQGEITVRLSDTDESWSFGVLTDEGIDVAEAFDEDVPSFIQELVRGVGVREVRL